jgi:hypothetical protein
MLNGGVANKRIIKKGFLAVFFIFGFSTANRILTRASPLFLQSWRFIMCVRKSVPTEAVPLDHQATLLDQLIGLSEAQPVQRINLTGHQTIDIFLGLCRRGFLNVTCRTAAEGPHTTEDSADSLWIFGTESSAELRTMLANCGRDLRNGGKLLVSLDDPVTADAVLALSAVLVRCGFTPIRNMISAGRIFLLCERQPAVNTALAA